MRGCRSPSWGGGWACRHRPWPSGSSGWSRAATIRGYRAEVDPRAVGLSLSAIIRVRPSPGQIENVAERARETPEVVECHRVTGDDCYVMRAHLRDVMHLEEVIDRFTVLGQTTTSIMQSSPVPGRPLDLS